MRALVVGGTGFIGSHIVKDLLVNGIRVRILIRKDRDIPFPIHREVEFMHGNISEIDDLKKCTRNIDLIFSAFGILGQWNIPEQKYWETNTQGVKNLLESCPGHIRQFIHISSAGVLGPLPDGVVADESFPYNPSNIYERSKCEAEKEIVNYGQKQGMPFTIIRPEFVYGPDDRHVLNLFKAVKAKKFVLIGNGKSLLHPTYIDDLIHGIRLCTNNQKAIGKTFLITGKRPLTVRELANTIAEELEIPLPKLRAPLFLASTTAVILELYSKIFHADPPLTRSRVKFLTQNRAFSFDKSRRELGFVPTVDFREGVRRTIRWYREHKYL